MHGGMPCVLSTFACRSLCFAVLDQTGVWRARREQPPPQPARAFSPVPRRDGFARSRSLTRSRSRSLSLSRGRSPSRSRSFSRRWLPLRQALYYTQMTQ